MAKARSGVPGGPQVPRRAVQIPLPPIDTGQVAQFWDRARSSGSVGPTAPLPESVGPFGDSVELADELIELVLSGRKRATAGALADYEAEGCSLPCSGSLWVATDGAGRPRAVLRTTDVRVGPLESVDESFAWDEGEGDRTREGWLAAHEAFFRRHLPFTGAAFDPAMATVFERFEVVFSE